MTSFTRISKLRQTDTGLPILSGVGGKSGDL
jgi:hypothetical protein